jgi:hypothetical protein
MKPTRSSPIGQADGLRIPLGKLHNDRYVPPP